MKTLPALVLVTSGFLCLAGAVPLRAATERPAPLPGADWHGIRAAYETGRRVVIRQADGSHVARNPGQAWRTEFAERGGFRVKPDEGGWRWGLSLRSYGTGGKQVALRRPAASRAEGNRLAVRWDGTLSEWFVNGARGLQQGWTFAREPAGAKGRLRLELAVSGGLAAEIAPGGDQVAFTDRAGAAVVTYGGLAAWDADGRKVPVRFVRGAKEGGRFAVVADARGARYPVMIDPIAQQAYVKASNTGAGDGFGSAVAISGDTVVVGAPGEDGDGLATDPGASNGSNGDPTDNSVFGAGAAYVFVRTGSGWAQQAYLKGVLNPFIAPTSSDGFGSAVAIDGNTIVVGSPAKSSFRGAAFVFQRAGNAWTAAPVRVLASPDSGVNGFFGQSVAISGNRIVVGASGIANSAAYVFARSGTTWNNEATLRGSNTETSDNFGTAVAISGATIAVGASLEDSDERGTQGAGANNNAPSSGAAYVFVHNGAAWTQQAYLKASNAEGSDGFGGQLDLDGSTLLVSALSESSGAAGVNGNGNDNGTASAGAAYVFVRRGDAWSQQAYLKASNPGEFDQFGRALAVSADTAVIGASGERSAATGFNGDQGDNGATSSGAVYVFQRTGTAWKQTTYVKASNTGAQDQFGGAVALGGGTLVVGARAEDGNRTGLNGNQADNTAADAGAAYFFALPESVPTAPAVRISGKKTRRLHGAHALIRGTATDINGNLQRVEVKVGPAKWKKARGLAKWSYQVRGLKFGRTRVQARATDLTGKRSRIAKLAFIRR